MKKIILSLMLILVAAPSYAVNGIKMNKAAIVQTGTSNQINWNLNRAGDLFELQNSTTPSMLVDIYQNPLNNNKISDTTVLDCNNTITTLTPGVDTLCQVPYTALMAMASKAVVNGSSGHYSIVGEYNTPTTWSLSAPGTVTVLQNSTTSTINVLYYVDYYYNNTATVSGNVNVTCINKTFTVTYGNARICELPANTAAQVQLTSQSNALVSSGGFMILP